MTLQLITTKLHGHPDWHADSFEDFQELLSWLDSRRLTIYRGQDADWPLLPYISRRKPKRSSFLEMERTILDLFKKEVESWLEVPPTNDWDWLALAQHHSLATRLLDWTLDPIIAMWFALRTIPKKRKNSPEVWIFTPEKKDIIDTKETSSPFRGTRTKVFLPAKQFPRIKVQKGAFTVFKHMAQFSKPFVSLERNKLLRRKLQRVRFPSHRRRDLLKVLDKIGVNEDKMFPDLDKVGKKLMEQYTKQ